jgi:hypothetical protein
VPHHVDAATVPGPRENFDAALASAPTLLCNRQTFLKQTNVYFRRAIYSSDFY